MAFPVLKVSYQGEVRRSLIETEVSYDVVLKTISEVFPDLKDYSAKYADEEGDICTLCRASFPDFLAVCKAGKAGEASQNQKLLLKLELRDAVVAKPQTLEEQIKEKVLRSLGATDEKNLEEKILHGFQDFAASAPMMGPLRGLFKGMCKGKGKGKDEMCDEKLHFGVVCDGCGATPIQGPRFKCQSCPDYDLCESCHGKKAELHGGDFADHEFHRIDCSHSCPMKGFFKGKGKGKGKGKCFQFAEEGGVPSDLITPKMMASLLTCKLPEILPHLVSQHHGQALHVAMQHVPQLRSVLESLKPLLEKTEGLEPCAAALERAFGSAEAAGEFLLSLVTALDLLPFERQIAFFEEVFTLNWEKVQELMNMGRRFMPCIAEMLQHRHVTCDGCGASPLKGPRFKCRSCDDYDLCADCYSQKRNIKDGQCAEHDFECIPVDCHGAFPWMGKGMCHGKAKGKGKHDGCHGPMAWMGPMKGFFKGMCKGKGKGKQEEPQQENSDTLSFPVEVADGRSLQISWMRGEDPMTVALGFAQEFGIQADELATIADFVRHAEEVSSATGKEPKQDEPTKEDEPKQDEPKKAAEQNTEVTQEPKEAEPKAAEAEEPKKEAVAECRACATPGCKFQATWHATHCCHACAAGRGHGPKCEHVEQSLEKELSVSAGVEELKADAEEVEVQAAAEVVRFSFPIMLDDGRELRMQWQSGDDLNEVAMAFAQEHGIPEELVPQMVDFAQQQVGPVKAPEDKPKETDKTPLQLLKDMGFTNVDDQVLEDLLSSNGNDVTKVVETLMLYQ